MSGAELSLAISVFLASAVEAVEAFTIVLAVGSTRRWSSTLAGVGVALVALCVLIVVLGPALTNLPVDILRLVVGGLLLVFGLQWLRKAILRAGGVKALHDEEAIFAEERAAARRAGRADGFDSYSFAIAFKAVLLEGVEVAFIVITFGANQDDVPLAAAAAAVAVLAVLIVGVGARAPLARVPENLMKLTVGIVLTTFGLFWGAEGAGVVWPGEEAALVALALLVSTASWLMVKQLREDGGARIEASR